MADNSDIFDQNYREYCGRLSGVNFDLIRGKLGLVPEGKGVNESDDEFPAKCRVLFQKHAEFYLDP